MQSEIANQAHRFAETLVAGRGYSKNSDKEYLTNTMYLNGLIY
jgi:hypothetical protein